MGFCLECIINEIWEVQHLLNTTNHSQFVLILNDSSHYCICLYLIYSGFVCKHFFAIMLQSKIAQFNIKLIPSWWYSKEGLMEIDRIQETSIRLLKNKEMTH